MSEGGAVVQTISIDTRTRGRIFRGIGGVTSNGMTKLLVEYPQAERDEILDFLFTPKFGASFHTVKVEIGSDANGTCGTEPSHMRKEDDFDITRGVGLWLAQEAKRRNPAIILDAIRWGTPAWVTDNEKKYQYYLNFLTGARDVYGLHFDYLAPDENEGDFSIDWVVDVLRPGLDRDGFALVQLSGADSTEDWNIEALLKGNPDLRSSIGAVTRHYKQDSPQYIRDCGIEILNSEDIAPFRHAFSYALDMAYKIIRSYASGKMVQYVMHPIIEAIYDNLPYTCKSILHAAHPWSGHYHVESSLWVVAQFTQFIAPGWQYLDSGCHASQTLSYLTLQDPSNGDISLVILNRSESAIDVAIEFDGLAVSSLSCWKTCEEEQFIRLDDVEVVMNTAKITIAAQSVYSLTTTEGQQKGTGATPLVTTTTFPLPYTDDFSSYQVGTQPRYTIDQAGAFEIQAGGRDGHRSLVQVLTLAEKPIDWERRPTPNPYTVLGGQELTNYSVSIDFAMDEMPGADYEGYVMLGARCNHNSQRSEFAQAYSVRLYHNRRWVLFCGAIALMAGRVDDFSLGAWHTLSLHCEDDQITLSYDGDQLCTLKDSAIPSGNVIIGSGYNVVRYAQVTISPIAGSIAQCRRYPITHQAVKNSGSWREVGSYSDNYHRTLLAASAPGSTLEFSFSGPSLVLVGVVDNESGRAEVFIDGELIARIDGYSATKYYRRSLFSAYDLEDAIHTCTLRVLGTSHEDSLHTNVQVNAIEVAGELLNG